MPVPKDPQREQIPIEEPDTARHATQDDERRDPPPRRDDEHDGGFGDGPLT